MKTHTDTPRSLLDSPETEYRCLLIALQRNHDDPPPGCVRTCIRCPQVLETIRVYVY